ncbi:MAG: hypothetical protein CMQ41_04890 [Gammaproteobacteria bacterium]|nr:hypothetical protein [Gammaproteobacteria bacterium]|tara:strand:- start:125 stop:532 length:408 start_codon:yes stop_codon:yes gene_type:complete
MLSKFLITAAVILGAFFVIRQRHGQSEIKSPPTNVEQKPLINEKQDSKDTLAADMRVGAYIFLVLMVGLGATLYYLDWKDDHVVLTINLHRDNASAPVSYEVYKYQLEARSFTTIDGRSIAVASNERMEIIGLDN